MREKPSLDNVPPIRVFKKLPSWICIAAEATYGDSGHIKSRIIRDSYIRAFYKTAILVYVSKEDSTYGNFVAPSLFCTVFCDLGRGWNQYGSFQQSTKPGSFHHSEDYNPAPFQIVI